MSESTNGSRARLTSLRPFRAPNPQARNLENRSVPAVAEDMHTDRRRVCIVSASGQNVFFAELLDALADALAGAGLQIERSVDRFPPWDDELTYLFVPHEYLALVDPRAHPTPAHFSRS